MESLYETLVDDLAYRKACLVYFETKRNFGIGNFKDDVIEQLEDRVFELLTLIENEVNKESV